MSNRSATLDRSNNEREVRNSGASSHATLNYSLAGIGLRTTLHYPFLRFLDVTLSLSKGLLDSLRCQCVVAWEIPHFTFRF